MLKKYHFSFFLLFLSWASLLIPSLIYDEHISTILNFTIFLLIIFILLILLIDYVIKKNFSFFFQSLIISLILFLILLALVFSTFNFFLNSSPLIKIIIMVVSFKMLFGLQIFILKIEKSFFIVLLLFLSQIFQITFSLNVPTKKNEKNQNFISEVNFKKKPNIIVFTFDGLVPKKFLEEQYQIYFPKNNHVNKLKILRNSFSENIMTKPALNTMLYLDPVNWRNEENHRGIKGSESYFSGINPSPLYEILKNNEYNVATGYLPGAWSTKGKYIDEYNLNSRNEKIFPMFCRWQLPSYYLQLFFYCKVDIYIKKIFNKKYFHYHFKDISQIRDKEDKQFYLKAIKSLNDKLNSDKNWFYFQHIYRPGHTNDDYLHNEKNFTEFKKFYQKRVNEAFNLMHDIIEIIDKSSKNTILIVAGDHGALLSKSENININQTFEKVRYEILDKHAIFLSYYDPKNICMNNIQQQEAKYKINTPTMTLNSVLSCLTGGKVFKKEIKYLLPYQNFNTESLLYE